MTGSVEILYEYKKNLNLTSGNIYFCARHHRLAQRALSLVYRMQQKKPTLTQKQLINLLMRLGESSRAVGDFDLAIGYCQKCLDLLEVPSNRDIILISINLMNIGDCYHLKNDFKRSFAYLNRALSAIGTSKSEWEKDIKATIYERISFLYNETYIHKRPFALEYAHKALETLNPHKELFHKNKRKNHSTVSWYLAKNRITLGNMYTQIGDYRKAKTEGYDEAQYIIDNLLIDYPQGLLKSRLYIGKGEICLREGQLNKAITLLTESINIIDEEESAFKSMKAKILKIEALIRLRKMDEAYEDCIKVFKLENKLKTNHFKLQHATCLYHGAFIQYKQDHLKKSAEHFSKFFKEIQSFCKNFLNKKDYEMLENKNAFTIFRYDPKCSKDNLARYLKNSIDVFSAIYQSSHPFVADYIIPNYKESVKAWWIFW